MDDVQVMREQAARYRKLLATIDDRKTRDVLIAVATDLEAKADAAEGQLRATHTVPGAAHA